MGHTGVSQAARGGNNFGRRFAISPALGVGPAEKTEAAVVAAVRAGINKAIQKNGVPEMFLAQMAGCLKKPVHLLITFQAKKKGNILLWKYSPLFCFCEYGA